MILYRKALRVDARCMLAAEGLATLLTDEGTKLKLAGQPDLSFAKYKEAAQLYPPYAPAHYNMGIMYAERSQTDEALKARNSCSG
jgi:tetratricopeptide (TPR) repeat protein